MQKVGVVVLVLILSAPFAWADPSDATAEAPCPGYAYKDGIGRVCPQPDGTYLVMSPDGRSLGPVSHTDPIPPGPEPVLALTATAVECATSSTQYAIWVIYARASNDADGYSARVSTIRDLVAQAQQHVSNAAAAGGGTSKLRVVCDSDGQVTVKNEVLPTSLSGDNFDTIVDDLQNKGYNDDDKKYWVWYDDANACSCAGTGHWYSDSSDSVNNYNNGNHPDPFFAVTFAHNSARTWLHELSHTLGAVQNGAPSYSGTNYGHCVDGLDILCYDDGGGNTGSCIDFYCSGTCASEVWDCQRNTYYNLNPTSGSWLATHWNLGETYVRYINNLQNIAPTMTSVSCSPSSVTLGESTSCSFTATDAYDQVAYNVNWGDGATERVPATGFVASGTTRTSTHTFATDGVFTVRVTATDNNASNPLTSSALTTTVAVQAAPVMNQLSCSPNPTEVARSTTCSFRAADNSTGVYYTIDWGDGTTQRVPATGTTAPGQTRTATHAWNASGSPTVSVTATDNGSPALSSNAATLLMSVVPNAAPTMTSLSCTPNPVQAENPTSCTFAATDGSGGVYYTVDWADGSPLQRVPATGTVAPGTNQTVAHSFTVAANRTVSVIATDNGAPALASTPLTLLVNVTPSNGIPVMQSASCNEVGAGALTQCTLRATDSDSTGVRYSIEWGDATTSTFPASGYATPGTEFAVSHVYQKGGVYKMNITATDNGSPPRTSDRLQIIVIVSSDGVGPAMNILDPRPGRLYQSCGIQQALSGRDAVFLLTGCVKLDASDASGVKNVTVLIDGVVVAVDTTAPYTMEFPVPRARPDASISVIGYDNLGNSRRLDFEVHTV